MGQQLIKPEFGHPCNGCGYCCQEQACLLSEYYLDSTVAPCVALVKEGNQFRCGLVESPDRFLRDLKPSGPIEAFGSYFALALGVGRGCDSEI
jgi:hypothetical protein